MSRRNPSTEADLDELLSVAADLAEELKDGRQHILAALSLDVDPRAAMAKAESQRYRDEIERIAIAAFDEDGPEDINRFVDAEIDKLVVGREGIYWVWRHHLLASESVEEFEKHRLSSKLIDQIKAGRNLVDVDALMREAATDAMEDDVYYMMEQLEELGYV